MLCKSDRKFIESHLSKVSRSFALAIRVLDQPLRDYVGLSYLLFRVLDTVEDAKWESRNLQEEGFSRIDLIITEKTNIEHFHKFLIQNTDSMSISVGEKSLLSDLEQLIDLLSKLPKDIQNEIETYLISMSRGMKFFTCRNWGHFKLKNVSEVNLYCYFVAGLVGEMLTRLLFLSKNCPLDNTKLMADSVEFGLFLQKVNVLKDQVEDEKIGRYLVPDRLEIRKSLLSHADASIHYIMKIHSYSKPYALFCLMSLFLGMVSIPYIDSSFRLRKLVKPSRTATLQLLTQLQGRISNPDAIMQFYQKLRGQLELSLGTSLA